MFKLAVAFFALVAVGIQGRPQFDAAAYDCTGKADGFYPDTIDPQAYFACQGEALANSFVCGYGYKFNGVDTCVFDVQQEEQEVNSEVEGRERQTIPQVFSDNNDDGFVDDDFEGASNGPKRIFNIEFTKNIFPRSVVIIGKMNREQKNKFADLYISAFNN